MIAVRRYKTGLWYWSCGNLGGGASYGSSAHALRDAWLWCGAATPALVFT
jgi:hypothetical protein